MAKRQASSTRRARWPRSGSVACPAAGWSVHSRMVATRLVPSNYWRAREVVQAVTQAGPAEAAELADAYREFCVPTGRREPPG